MKVILFDAGGVLVHPNWHTVVREAAALGAALSVEDLERNEHLVWCELDVPDVLTSPDQHRASRFLRGVLERTGLDPAVGEHLMPVLEALRRRGDLWDFVHDDVADTLSTLRSRGFRLGVVSNSNGMVAQKLGRLGLSVHFETIVDSGVEGIEKPDPRLFQVALQRMGADAATTLYVGDLVQIDVVGARAAGLTPVLVDRADLRPLADVHRLRRLSDLLDHVGTAS